MGVDFVILMTEMDGDFGLVNFLYFCNMQRKCHEANSTLID
jgi:hypothetical protein